jgi:hypothetical protein
MEVKQQTYVIREFHWHCLKVCENPYLWATNRIVLPEITVHSFMNLIKGNTIPTITWVSNSHTSDGYSGNGQ